MTKCPAQKLTHRTTQKHVQRHDATNIYKNSSLFFGRSLLFYILITFLIFFILLHEEALLCLLYCITL